jgi:hypothetical protein
MIILSYCKVSKLHWNRTKVVRTYLHHPPDNLPCLVLQCCMRLGGLQVLLPLLKVPGHKIFFFNTIFVSRAVRVDSAEAEEVRYHP